MYSLPGLAVKNTIAGKVMAIEKRNHDLMFVDKTGKPILPESIKQPRWTDGRYVINGQDGRMNLLSVNGDTVLRQTYHRISALDPDRFVVYTDNYNAGMVDGRGRTIIPIEKQSLYSAYPDTNSVLISRSAKEFNDKIYNRDGKILISGFQYERYQPEKGLVGTVPDQNPEWYYWVKMAGSLKTGLYHWTGRQLVPPEYKYIFYGSDNHVLIAQTFPQAPANKELYGAYNLQGVMVLPAVYTYLRYTRDPNLQIGQHESGEKFGFVSVDKPGDARFEYELITNLYADHFAGKTSKGFVLLDPKGKQVTKDVFATMEHPLFKHVLVFEKQPRGNLVAVATRTGTAKGVWFGLNEKGEKFEFPPFPEEPKEHVQAEESVETVVEAAPMPNENKTAGQGSGPAYETVREKGDTHPAFIGGEQALKKYIDENLRYPPLAKEYAIQGRVVVTFVVETDGSLTNPQIIKDIGAGCGKEALRLVAVMPKWQPGTTGGKPVRAKFTLPVEFKLN
ncbi:MAG: TonB family protein [Saprospiraceae bacterium]|nr:TonB family protein [Saprospiraceae bacterium]